MSWLQLRIAVNKPEVEALEDALLASGAVSVTLEDGADDPILEPGVGETPLWNQLRVTGLYPSDIHTDLALQLLAENFPGQLQHCRWEILEDQPWETLWTEHYHPIQCGDRLWICPSWREPPNPEAVNLSLDPGLAFGSGTHATTFLCLQWLDAQPLAGKTVVDFGCGSGILAIAALLLGARQVIATDNDPQALLATRDNARRNGLDEAQLSVYLPQELPVVKADIVLANILAEPLMTLAPQLTALTAPGGQICLSGMIASQTDAVMSAYRQDFHFAPPLNRDEWFCLVAKKRL
ncbi:MAG: 50S ribosomal protein L11 methyltransferase [Gammaproteobacteria bacterium]|nr:50S ribosomal protein L11 methyltransferase [Gammaproteobacteria bacterium]MBQ0840859.1 50S ribosomal protein L11 methyltransferase [Gammaproteobacteria bacterium]